MVIHLDNTSSVCMDSSILLIGTNVTGCRKTKNMGHVN